MAESRLTAVPSPRAETAKPSAAQRGRGYLGVLWILFGAISYTTLTLLASGLVDSNPARKFWQGEVNILIYDRSMLIFATAFSMDVLNIFFEAKTTRLNYVLLPCFIKGTATTTNFLVRTSSAVMMMASDGRMLMLQRYICWAHTTPSVLMLVKMISKTITVKELLTIILYDELMLLTGAACVLATGPLKVLLAIMAHLFIIPVLQFLHRGLSEATAEIKVDGPSSAMRKVHPLMLLIWVVFGLNCDLALFGLVTVQTEEIIYLICDFSAKVLFSGSLMLASFKGMESRRVDVMRHIEESSKQKLIDELQSILEQKDRFLSSVSHELRTPLNGIIGISEGMLSGCCGVLSESVRRQIYIVRTSGARLLSLVNDVMDAAALRQQQLVLQCETIQLRMLVDDVLDLTRPLARGDVALQNHVPNGMIIAGDTGRVVQILNNLLGNAAKFTDSGFIRVSAKQYEDTHRVAISVLDTGTGIPQNKLHSIFLPFEQVDIAITKKYGGFGLGLKIVQDLVKAHGGDIWVQSMEGRGSCFTFTMPTQPGALPRPSTNPSPRPHGMLAGTPELETVPAYKQPLVVKTRDWDDADEPHMDMGFKEYDAAELALMASDQPFKDWGESNGPPSPEGARSMLEGPNKQFHYEAKGSYLILSVDDNDVNQAVLESMLTGTEYSLATAHDGTSALQYLETCTELPDLILLDYRMPGMDGVAVCKRLRELYPGVHRIPVILLSAEADEHMVVGGLDSGADDCLTKPFERAELLARIRARLRMQRHRLAAPARKLQRMPGSGGSHILSVGDDDINQMMLQRILESEGYLYLKARTALECLTYFADGLPPPDLLLLDFSLPDAKGDDVCRTIRETYKMTEVPIIMLTGRGNDASAADALDAGANDHIAKPFRRAELVARIRTQLRACRALPLKAAAGHTGNDTGSLPGQAGAVPAFSGSGTFDALPMLALMVGQDPKLAARLGPSEVAELMSKLFSRFEAAAEEARVVEVQVSSDCYIVTALPTAGSPIATQLTRLLALGRKLLEVVHLMGSVGADRTAVGSLLQLRVALHVGPAQITMTGSRQRRRCFFGEAVSDSRVLSGSAPVGLIVASKPAAQLLMKEGVLNMAAAPQLLSGSTLLWVMPEVAADATARAQIASPAYERRMEAVTDAKLRGAVGALAAELIGISGKLPLGSSIGGSSVAGGSDCGSIGGASFDGACDSPTKKGSFSPSRLFSWSKNKKL